MSTPSAPTAKPSPPRQPTTSVFHTKCDTEQKASLKCLSDNYGYEDR